MTVKLVLAGNGTQAFSGDGGPATSAQLSGSLNGPSGGLGMVNSGVLYIGDTFNNRIRAISTDGVIQTVAGDVNQCCYSGDGSAASSIFSKHGPDSEASLRAHPRGPSNCSGLGS